MSSRARVLHYENTLQRPSHSLFRQLKLPGRRAWCVSRCSSEYGRRGTGELPTHCVGGYEGWGKSRSLLFVVSSAGFLPSGHVRRPSTNLCATLAGPDDDSVRSDASRTFVIHPLSPSEQFPALSRASFWQLILFSHRDASHGRAGPWEGWPACFVRRYLSLGFTRWCVGGCR